VGAFESALADHGSNLDAGAGVHAAEQSFRKSQASAAARVG